MLLLGLVRLPSEGDSLHNIVILMNTFYSAPEIEGVVYILL